MNSLSTSDLQRFCAGKNDIRDYLQTPWRHNGFIYATNGHWCVRTSDDGRDDLGVPGKQPNAEKLFNLHSRAPGTFLTLPEISSKRDLGLCSTCEGRGVTRTSDCDDCDDCEGKGHFFHGRHEYECQECEQSGRVGDSSAPEAPCERCEGTGEDIHIGIDVFTGHFAAHYVRRIAELPGVTASVDPDSSLPMVFQFDGGQGLLMPRRKD